MVDITALALIFWKRHFTHLMNSSLFGVCMIRQKRGSTEWMINSGKEAVGGGKAQTCESTVHGSLSSHSTGREFRVGSAGPCTLWAVGVYNDFGVGAWRWKGSYLYSESPVIFQYIWKNVKERFCRSKCLTQSQEENNTASGEFHFFHYVCLLSDCPSSLPLLAGDLFSTVTAKWNSHSPTVNSLFLILWISAVDLLSGILDP